MDRKKGVRRIKQKQKIDKMDGSRQNVSNTWERGPGVASLSRYPRVRNSIPPLGTFGNVSEN